MILHSGAAGFRRALKAFIRMPAKKIIALAVCAMVSILLGSADAAPSKRKTYRNTASSAEKSQIRDHIRSPIPDEFVKLGVVVHVEDKDLVIVKMIPKTDRLNRIATYYGCDANMTPTSILEKTDIAHKSCSIFKVLEGSAIKGDLVMVKYENPQKRKAEK